MQILAHLVTALGLVLVVEGVAYALFPAQMKRMMETVQVLPVSSLRNAGLLAAVVGVALVWLVRS
ncbi:MAG: DUF2065 domain-containing protein [Alphaproteobacteria bacterium]|nr:DUF2065 domain-containing protein [Alphaproteobacteria bacterium]MDP6516201.1 DUF2065 domain-containing protein [Alphaproteobacteria bacterium]